MNARKMMTFAGMAAGAAVGATSLYVAMKPKLRRNLKKKGFSKESLHLLGREIKTEAGEVAEEVRDFVKQEARVASRMPRRWFRRRVEAGKEAAQASEES